jgi:hypothetical protein
MIVCVQLQVTKNKSNGQVLLHLAEYGKVISLELGELENVCNDPYGNPQRLVMIPSTSRDPFILEASSKDHRDE